jgi:hypothetical protein
VAAEKVTAGYGGTAAVSRATGGAQQDHSRGQGSLTAPAATGRVRCRGGRRPVLSQSNPALLKVLRQLRKPATMEGLDVPAVVGLEKLASALRGLNHAVSANTVNEMLMTPAYSHRIQPQESRRQLPARPRRAIPTH